MKKKAPKNRHSDLAAQERSNLLMVITIFLTGMSLICAIYIIKSDLITIGWMTSSVLLVDLFAYWSLIGRKVIFKK